MFPALVCDVALCGGQTQHTLKPKPRSIGKYFNSETQGIYINIICELTLQRQTKTNLASLLDGQNSGNVTYHVLTSPQILSPMLPSVSLILLIFRCLAITSNPTTCVNNDFSF